MIPASDAFAYEEQHRAEGLARRAGEIASTPGHPSTGSLPMYQDAARRAFEAAAGNATQPAGGA